ncbi:MAG: tRNA (adenosine(37)-N6)-dimethylallyltransferase MiaA [bacterium]
MDRGSESARPDSPGGGPRPGRDPRPIAVLLGPTASGKTELALALAGRAARRGLRLEVIGADARQIYRGLSAGTAKPTDRERAALPHSMIDVAGPEETFNAARFAREARACAEESYGRGALPLVVGGSGLYIRALLEGLFEGPEAQPALRRALEEEAEREGDGALHRRLAACDPETAARVHPQDRKRVIRALEVYETTGRPISALREEGRSSGFLRPLYLGIDWPGPIHARRIEERVRRMLAGGMVEEAAGLAGAGLTGAPAFEGLGYAEALSLHRGEMDRETAAGRIAALHLGYAKRQRTWFRRTPGVVWLEPGRLGMEGAADRADEILAAYLRDFPAFSACRPAAPEEGAEGAEEAVGGEGAGA